MQSQEVYSDSGDEPTPTSEPGYQSPVSPVPPPKRVRLISVPPERAVPTQGSSSSALPRKLPHRLHMTSVAAERPAKAPASSSSAPPRKLPPQLQLTPVRAAIRARPLTGTEKNASTSSKTSLTTRRPPNTTLKDNQCPSHRRIS